MVIKAVKKPLVVEVVQFTGNTVNVDFLKKWSNDKVFLSTRDTSKIYVETIEGQVHTYVGSYIVKGPAGEIWPIRKDIFEETYEVLESTDDLS